MPNKKIASEELRKKTFSLTLTVKEAAELDFQADKDGLSRSKYVIKKLKLSK